MACLEMYASVWYGDVRHCGVSTPHCPTHNHCHWFGVFCVYAPDNRIGDAGAAGAAALVEGLKEMTQLKELYLYGECCMVGIVCEVAVMSCIKYIAG